MWRLNFHGKFLLKGNLPLSSYPLLFRWNHLKVNISIKILKPWRPPLSPTPSFSVPGLFRRRGRGVINSNKNFAWKFASTILCKFIKQWWNNVFYETNNKCFIIICTLNNIPIRVHPFSTHTKLCERIKWMILNNLFSKL